MGKAEIAGNRLAKSPWHRPAAATDNIDMSRHHFVRVGALGNVGRFTSVDAVAYPRASRVIVRTSRGLETGEVLGPADERSACAAIPTARFFAA